MCVRRLIQENYFGSDVVMRVEESRAMCEGGMSMVQQHKTVQPRRDIMNAHDFPLIGVLS